MALMKRVIAIDSSGTEQAIVLLGGEAFDILASEAWRRERTGEDRTLLERAQQLMRSAGWSVESLSCVVAARGPGSFTGLRVGLSVAAGLAYGLGISLYLVDSLQVLAAESKPQAGAIRDAGRREVYAWRPGLDPQRMGVGQLVEWIPQGLPLVVEPAAALAQWSPKHADQEVKVTERSRLPQALAVVAIEALSRGKPVRYHEIEPLYVQPAAAQERKEAQL